MSSLIHFCWGAWGLDVLMVFGLLTIFARRRNEPGSKKALAMLLLFVALVFLTFVAGVLRSGFGAAHPLVLATLAIVLVTPWPWAIAAGRRSVFRAEARTASPELSGTNRQHLSESIRENRISALEQALQMAPGSALSPDDLDRWLVLAVEMVRERGFPTRAMECLLQAGADPRRARRPSGGDLVNYLVVDTSSASQEALRRLLEGGADPNAIDPLTGEAPLHRAGYDPVTVEALLQHGADLEARQSDGLTPLLAYVLAGNWESARKLVEAGADVTVETPRGLNVTRAYEQRVAQSSAELPPAATQFWTACMARSTLQAEGSDAVG